MGTTADVSPAAIMTDWTRSCRGVAPAVVGVPLHPETTKRRRAVAAAVAAVERSDAKWRIGAVAVVAASSFAVATLRWCRRVWAAVIAVLALWETTLACGNEAVAVDPL